MPLLGPEYESLRSNNLSWCTMYHIIFYPKGPDNSRPPEKQKVLEIFTGPIGSPKEVPDLSEEVPGPLRSIRDTTIPHLQGSSYGPLVWAPNFFRRL